MIELLKNIHMAAVQIVLLVGVVVALLSDLFLGNKYRHVGYYCAQISLFIAFFVSIFYLGQYPTVAFSGLLIADDMGHLMLAFISLCVFLCFFYSRQYIDERHIPSGDFYTLGLFSTLGMVVLVEAHSMLTIYLGLELLSLPLYALTAIRRNNADSSEAAMKYFAMGAIASGMLLYGMSLIYGATGALDLQDIANSIGQNWSQNQTMITFAMVFIVVGIGFKLAAVPFHMWAPDVYQGAPTAVTLLISTAPKIAAIAMLFRLLTFGLADAVVQWQQVLLVMALASAALGNLFAIAQSNIKRMLSYSAISHIGYALFGIIAANAAGYSAALYYILIYAVMSVAAFGFIVLLSHTGMEVEHIDDLKGLNKNHPWLAFMAMIVLFSLAGVPPTVGFFTKLLVLKALVDVGMLWVAVLGLLFAVIGAYYYLRVVKVMYFDEPLARSLSTSQISRGSYALFSLNCLALLYLGIFPSGLLNQCMTAFS